MTAETKKRSRTIAGVVLVLTFAAGAAAGLTIDRLLTTRLPYQARITRGMSPVLDELELTPQQRSQADVILERSAPRSEAAMREAAEQLQRVSDSLDAELRAILTNEQRARLDSLRRRPIFMLKRKTPGSGMTVDTLRPRMRDTVKQR